MFVSTSPLLFGPESHAAHGRIVGSALQQQRHRETGPGTNQRQPYFSHVVQVELKESSFSSARES